MTTPHTNDGPTPRTDEHLHKIPAEPGGRPQWECVPADFARQLEQYLAAERAINAELVYALEAMCNEARYQNQHRNGFNPVLEHTGRAALARAQEVQP